MNSQSYLDEFEVVLTKEDPYERIEELCQLDSPFRYSLGWRKFKNGYFMKCNLFINNDKVSSVSHFIQDLDYIKARDQIIAKLLYTNGISPLEFTEHSVCDEEVLLGENSTDLVISSDRVEELLQSALDELLPNDLETDTQLKESSIISEITKHLTPDEVLQNAPILSFVETAFASLPDGDAKNQALGYLSMFAGMAQSSNVQKKSSSLTEEINDIE